MNHATDDATATSHVMHAITDTQETIRAYDAKAEVLAILLTLAIGVINLDYLKGGPSLTRSLAAISTLSAIVAIAFLGRVLHPNKDVWKKVNLGAYVPRQVFFLSDISASPQKTVSNLSDVVRATEWLPEYVYEHMKLSSIRDAKHLNFLWALGFAGGCWAVIAILVIASWYMGSSA